MSSGFLDDLFDNLKNTSENETPDDLDDTVEEAEAELTSDEEDTQDEGVAEEVSEAEAVEEASETNEAEDDDETELSPIERKAYGRLKALQDERTKRQDAEAARKNAEAERDQLHQQLAEMRRQQQEAASQNLPDPYTDTDGYIAAREAQFQQELTKQALAHSINRAAEKYGEEEVTNAAKWFEDQIASNPHMPLRQNMLSQPDQMEYVLSSYRQSQKVNALLSGDVSGLVAELEKAGYAISKADTTPTGAAPAATVTQPVAATPVTPTIPAPAAPRRSKLAATASTTTAAPAAVSMLDSVLRR